MKKVILVAMFVTGCASGNNKNAFFVQESVTLGKVVVDECQIIAFRNIDSGKQVKREFCKKIHLEGRDLRNWGRIRPKDNDEDVAKGSKEVKADEE